MEQLPTEYFFILTKNIRHEETTKKSSKKFDFGKPFFLLIQNGRHRRKIQKFFSQIRFFITGSFWSKDFEKKNFFYIFL